MRGFFATTKIFSYKRRKSCAIKGAEKIFWKKFGTKAILFYCGYLQSEYAGDFLPKILGETLEAILSMFGDRIGKLLLKQAAKSTLSLQRKIACEIGNLQVAF